MATQNPNNLDGPVVDDLGWGWGWWWLFWLFLVCIFFFGGWGWGGWWWGGPWWGQRRYYAPQQQQAVNPPAAATAPTGFFQDRKLTLEDQTVDKVLDASAFTLKPIGVGGRDLLVVVKGRNKHHPKLKEGEKVKVTGQVEPFDREAFQKQAGTDLAAAMFDAYAGQPAVLASSVTEEANSKTASK